MNSVSGWIRGPPLSLFDSQVRVNNVSWPSLYNPVIEVGSELSSPVQPGAYYLQLPEDIFRFTLYWNLIFHLPFGFLAGTYAFFNFLFPPARPISDSVPLFPSSLASHPPSAPPQEWTRPLRLNAGRSRLTFALLVFVAFLSLSLLSAVVGAAIIGFVLAGVYTACGFYMSTWIPFIWAVIHSLVALLGIWPSVIDII
ncbi:hypothetical protein BU15DRAFT_42427 [Melanogaster broomeanus]|nr:hypothetical protein BU15DRAFT_42427 [Melanogaster broomeanus]